MFMKTQTHIKKKDVNQFWKINKRQKGEKKLKNKCKHGSIGKVRSHLPLRRKQQLKNSSNVTFFG